MIDPKRSDQNEPRLRDPEVTGRPEGERGASSRKFLGIPAWATAVAFAALAAVMYLIMLTLV